MTAISKSSRDASENDLHGFTSPSVSGALTFDEAIARLKASPHVDGLAAFGSRALDQAGAASDYDLLVWVDGLPASIFQMITAIGERLADTVLVETKTADALLISVSRPHRDRSRGCLPEKCRPLRSCMTPPIGCGVADLESTLLYRNSLFGH